MAARFQEAFRAAYSPPMQASLQALTTSIEDVKNRGHHHRWTVAGRALQAGWAVAIDPAI